MNAMMVKIKSWRVCSKLDNDKNLFDILTRWMTSFQEYNEEDIKRNIKEFIDNELDSYNTDERLRIKSKLEHYFL